MIQASPLRIFEPHTTYPDGDPISQVRNLGADHYVAPAFKEDPAAPSLEEIVQATCDAIERNPEISLRITGEGHSQRYVFKVPTSETKWSNDGYNPASYFSNHEISLRYNKHTDSLEYVVPASSLHARDSKTITIPLTYYRLMKATMNTQKIVDRANKQYLLHADPERKAA